MSSGKKRHRCLRKVSSPILFPLALLWSSLRLCSIRIRQKLGCPTWESLASAARTGAQICDMWLIKMKPPLGQQVLALGNQDTRKNTHFVRLDQPYSFCLVGSKVWDKWVCLCWDSQNGFWCSFWVPFKTNQTGLP